jgi:oligosaccharide 4-alpha-D-glucosyltransferase
VFALPLHAADYLSHARSPQGLHFETTAGPVDLDFHTPAVLEVRYQPTGVQQLESFTIAGAPEKVASDIRETATEVVIASHELTARVQKSPFKISYYRDGTLLFAEDAGFTSTPTSPVGFSFKLSDDEKLLGGGERVLGMDRRGHRLPLYNKASYGYTTHASQMYFSLPAVLSSRKYLLLFDNSAKGWLDLGKTKADVLAFEAVGGRSSYVVVAGPSYPNIVESYTHFSGRQPLPPRWAFGNFSSRFGYHTEAETRSTVAKFAEEDFPLDAVVLDLYWFGKDIKGLMGRLDWDRNAFPNPEKMIADFRANGVKTVLVTEPFILTTSSRWQEAVDAGVLARKADGTPKVFEFYFGKTGLIDVFDKKAADWFWSIYRGLTQQGVAGWWGDLGEPEVHPEGALHVNGSADVVHNAYGHQWAKMVFENQLRDVPTERPFIMMRSGAPGSQRYGMIPWTGDVDRSWGGLKPQVELSLTMGLFGFGYLHSDLGGFAGGKVFDRELYIRWLQYGVFQPVFRPHAQDHIAAEPVLHDQRTRDLLRPFVKLRYRMLPYIYTLAFENSISGMPLMRPVFFEDETNPKLMDQKRAYLWGDAFFVAPITHKGARSMAVDLPAGVWFDYWTDRRLEGARRHHIPVTLKTIPVLVRGGSFVPMVPDFRNTDEYSSAKLVLHYYADESVSTATGHMYEDDGKSPDSLESGNYELLEFVSKQSGGGLAIDLERAGGEYTGKPAQREIELVVHHWVKAVGGVAVGGQPLANTNRKAFEAGGKGWWYDQKLAVLRARFDWVGARAAIAVK